MRTQFRMDENFVKSAVERIVSLEEDGDDDGDEKELEEARPSTALVFILWCVR